MMKEMVRNDRAGFIVAKGLDQHFKDALSVLPPL